MKPIEYISKQMESAHTSRLSFLPVVARGLASSVAFRLDGCGWVGIMGASSPIVAVREPFMCRKCQRVSGVRGRVGRAAGRAGTRSPTRAVVRARC